MSKDLPVDDNGKNRPHGRQKFCFTRTEAFLRAISFSCTEVLWRVRWQH